MILSLTDLPKIHEADVGRWAGREPPELPFTIDQLVPEGMVTLLSADGGAGKSMLMQTALMCGPVGLPFLERMTTGGATAGIFAEDSEAVLHVRHGKICAELGVDPVDLSGRSFQQSYQGQEAILWDENGPTMFLHDLEQQLAEIPNLRLVTIDNAALVYADSEIDRRRVTAFLNHLNGMAGRLKVGMILSTHTSKSSAESGRFAASGSTAWINASRSVLLLRPEEGTQAATLLHLKANHAKKADPITLEWTENGVLMAAREPDRIEQQIQRTQIDRAVFEAVAERWSAGDPLSDAPQTGERYLPRVLSRKHGFRSEDVKAAMLAFRDNGFLTVERKNARSPKGLKIARKPPFLAENGNAYESAA